MDHKSLWCLRISGESGDASPGAIPLVSSSVSHIADPGAARLNCCHGHLLLLHLDKDLQVSVVSPLAETQTVSSDVPPIAIYVCTRLTADSELQVRKEGETSWRP